MYLAFPLVSYLGTSCPIVGLRPTPTRWTVKDVRRLKGCVAALSRFISKSVERALPFFEILKKAGPMKWTLETDVAL